MEKIIIGFIGEKGVGKTTASKFLAKHGFYRAEISKKVEEFAKHLFSDMSEEKFGKSRDEILHVTRLKGISVSHSYWVNLVLTSISSSKDCIVVDDVIEEELPTIFKTYQIYREGVSTKRLPNIETIENDGDIKSFLKKIEFLLKNKK